MSNQQFIAVKSVTNKRDLNRLKQQLIMAHQCLVEKDKIIEGLRLDLAHVVELLPRLQPNRSVDKYVEQHI